MRQLETDSICIQPRRKRNSERRSFILFIRYLCIFLFILILLVINLLTGFSIGIGWIVLLVSIYFAIALKRVYKQSWLKTITKAFLTYFLYSLVMAFVMVIGIVISAASL